MAFHIGQSIIYLAGSVLSRNQTIKHGTVTKMNKRGDEIWLDNAHKPEDCLYAAFAYPNLPQCHTLLTDIIEMSARHDRESKDMLTRQIQMSNEMVRVELK